MGVEGGGGSDLKEEGLKGWSGFDGCGDADRGKGLWGEGRVVWVELISGGEGMTHPCIALSKKRDTYR